MIGAKPNSSLSLAVFRRVKGLQMFTFSCYITSRYPLPLVSMSSTTHQISPRLFTLLSLSANGESFACLKKPP